MATCSLHTLFQEGCDECRTDRSANASANISNQQDKTPAWRNFSVGVWILLGVLAVILVLVVLAVAKAALTVVLGVVQQLAMLLPVGAIAGGIYLWKRRSDAHVWEQPDRIALAGLVAGLIWLVANVASETAGGLLGVLPILAAAVAAWLTYRLDTARIERYWPHDSPWPKMVQDRLSARHPKDVLSASAPATDASQAPSSVTDGDDATG